MQRVGGSKAGQCHGWIMLLEAGQADRSGRDAFVPRAAESFSTQKNSARYSRLVSNGQVIVEDGMYSKVLYDKIILCLHTHANERSCLSFTRVGVLRWD